MPFASRSLLLALLCLSAPLSRAQAPIERRIPPTLRPYQLWPTSAAVRNKALLLVSTFDPYEPPFRCRVLSIDRETLGCAGTNHHAVVTFARTEVAMLQSPPPTNIAPWFLRAGGISLGLALLCGVDGGPICIVPAAVGLGLIAAAAVVAIVEHVHADYIHLHGNGLIYAAPGSASDGEPAVQVYGT